LTAPGYQSFRITIAGAGNIAWHLGYALIRSGYRIERILNRNEDRGRTLARELHTIYYNSWSVPAGGNDLVILAVSDTALPEVIGKINCSGALVVHTSGTVPMDILGSKFDRFGVMYPFQTLTKGVPSDFSLVPLCLEASGPAVLQELKQLAGSLSQRISLINSDQRRHLHLAGVIINNFTNHLIARSMDYLRSHDIDTRLIMPLLHETIDKVEKTTPFMAQTGPARRNDTTVIREHLGMLNNDPGLKNLYSLITDSIIAYYYSGNEDNQL
jgi:predicted short-subunit dehydrogenase-like oxidoreductase (DUF2520 family)